MVRAGDVTLRVASTGQAVKATYAWDKASQHAGRSTRSGRSSAHTRYRVEVGHGRRRPRRQPPRPRCTGRSPPGPDPRVEPPGRRGPARPGPSIRPSKRDWALPITAGTIPTRPPPDFRQTLRPRGGPSPAMTFPIQVGPSTITMNRDDRVLVCQPDATIAGLGDDGFFTRDTRFVSGYALWLNGRRPILLNASPIRFFSSRYEFTNDDLFDGVGPIPRQTLSIRLDRTVSGGVHEDIDIVNYARRAVRLVVEVELQSDFADIFDVRAGTIVRRGTVNTRWFSSRRELRTTYTNRDFRRELVVEVERADSRPQYANGRLLFVAEIAAKGTWHACTSWLPITRPGRGRRPEVLPCNSVDMPVAEVGRQPPPRRGRREHERVRPPRLVPGGPRPRVAPSRGPDLRAPGGRAGGRRAVVRDGLRARHAGRVDARDRRLPGVRGRRAAAAFGACRRPRTTQSATWSRARSCTRSATASSPRPGSCRTRRTTARTTRRRCS